MYTKIKNDSLKPVNYNAQELTLDKLFNDSDAFMDKKI
jgi:hypothetical protein